MNPLRWKREHQIAFLGAAVFGACIGIFAGVRQVQPSANLYWLWMVLWGAAGAAMGATGAFIRQLSRDRTSN
jgi:amino acid transporter